MLKTDASNLSTHSAGEFADAQSFESNQTLVPENEK